MPGRVQADPVAPRAAEVRLGGPEQLLRHPAAMPARADRHSPEATFALADDLARDRPDDLAGGRRGGNTAIVARRSPTVFGVSTVSSNAPGVYSSRYGSKAARRQSSTAVASSGRVRRTENGFCELMARSCPPPRGCRSGHSPGRACSGRAGACAGASWLTPALVSANGRPPVPLLRRLGAANAGELRLAARRVGERELKPAA